MLDIRTLSKLVKNKNTIAIGKTIYQWLAGEDPNGKPISHFAVILANHNFSQWVIHDPGLPGISNRLVNKKFQGKPVFGEIAVFEGLMG